MKAAILKRFGAPLAIETMPDPTLGTGEVIVDVVATRVLSYANEVFSGERKYLLDLPVIPGPGGIGRVRAIGPDAPHLAIGDWVSCDPTVRSRDDVLSPALEQMLLLVALLAVTIAIELLDLLQLLLGHALLEPEMAGLGIDVLFH